MLALAFVGMLGFIAVTMTLGFARLRAAPQLPAKSTGRRLLHDDLHDVVWNEELEGSGVGHCDPSTRAHELVAAYNEGRFEALADMYTKDSLRFVNGKLDDLTNGKPINPEQYTCQRDMEGRLQYHIGDVVSSGHNVAAVSGTLVVNRAMGGLALVLEFDEDTCKVETERLYFSTTSAVAREYNAKFACPCFPIAEDIGLCRETATSSRMDLGQRTEQCWRAIVIGDATAFANCFVPGTRSVTNGVRDDNDLGDRQAVDQMLQAFGYQADILHMIVEGFTVHTIVRQTVTAKNILESVDAHVYQSIHYNEDGRIDELLQVTDTTELAPLMAKAVGLAPEVMFWASEEAVSGMQGYVDVLGFPSDYTDHADATNFAVWTAEDLKKKNVCFMSVTVSDRVGVHQRPTPHSVFGHAHIGLQIGQTANAVRAVSESIYVDTLTNTVGSQGNGMGQHIVDLYLAVQVATGKLTDSQARSEYAARIISAHDNNGNLSTQGQAMLAQICNDPNVIKA